MSRKFIIAFVAAAALVSTALIAGTADARSGGGHSMGRGGGGGGHSMGRSAGRSGHVSARGSHGNSAKQGGIRSGSKLSGSNKPGKAAGLQSQKTGKSGSAAGTLNSGPNKLSSASKGLGAGPGKQGAAAAGNKTASTGLKAGPASGKVYRDQMGPTNNTTPTNQNAKNPTPPPKTTGGKGILVSKGKLPWIVKKGIDIGITTVVPVYGPAKAIYDAGEKLGPGISETLEKSKLSQEQHEKDKAADIEAGKARQEQGGGFLGGGLNSVDMDP